MAMRKLLSSSLISMLFLPCFSTLVLLLKSLLRTLHFQATTSTLSQSLNPTSLKTYLTVCNKVTSFPDTNVAIFQYERVQDEQIVCIICLSEIGEGEQVRKLNCSHLFHTSCFDKWIEHRRTSCPLCRCSLILLETKTQQHLEEEIEDEEVEDSATPLLAFVQREWWGVVHPSG